MASNRIYRNFIKGTMNKQLDERLVPDGQYIDAQNIRIDSTDSANSNVVKPAVGNSQVITIKTKSGNTLSGQYCVGSVSDPQTGYIYWLVHNPSHAGGKLDMIFGINARDTNDLKYVVYSASATRTALNFSPNMRITAIDIIDGVMYFTDGVNQPKQINLNRNYPDNVTEADLLVVKAPPAEAPLIVPIVTNKTESFMTDKIYCFAYRYKYSSGQYSAVSQFTLPAIYPSNFGMDDDDSTNAGMINVASGISIKYNSGPADVTDIELLFKHADSSDIFVIAKLNKRKLGIANNTVKTFDFTDERYVAVLPEYEILRLYDNVPVKALAQTYMNSRLMYGNYSDGFDMIDKNGNPVNVDFSANAISTPLNKMGGYTKSPGSYMIYGVKNVNDSVVNIDLSGVKLIPGTKIIVQITMDFDSSVMNPSSTPPIAVAPQVTAAYSIVLKEKYNSVYELAVSDEFKNAIGTSANINKDLTQNIQGTLTDAITSAMPTSIQNIIALPFAKYASGVTADGTPAGIIAVSGSSLIGIQIPAMVYKSESGLLGYVYFKVSTASVTIYDVTYQQSLHSNRSYQVGIMYMDDYGRSTPAIVSNSSSFFLNANTSATRNQIQVSIPVGQTAPAFATRYKFAIKESGGSYETIFSNFFFKDPSSRFAYFLLSGENARKITEDATLIVKSDSYGHARNLIQVKVLEKVILTEGEIIDNSPAGTYMKVSSENINIIDTESFTNGKITDVTNPTFVDLGSDILPMMKYPLYAGTENIQIPEGSLVSLNIDAERIGAGACESRAYSSSNTIIASRSYADFMKFWEGEGMSQILRSGVFVTGDETATETGIVYYPGVLVDNVYRAYTRAEVAANMSAWRAANKESNIFYYFVTDGALLSLEMVGVRQCNGVFAENNRKSYVSMDLKVYFTGQYLFVFETEPTTSDIDIFYESSQSFAIDKTTGYHMGNAVDQSLNTAAIDILYDFNCICFGNGVESYKIKDSLSGRRIYLGARATSMAYNEVRQEDRTASITYSGVYNDETNIDKLNQFVNGLVNYKNLESSFGSIQVLDGRKNDVMVIQENKISYVLTGKNLLSDSVDGGSVASVPEVLGTQIARIEEYGTVNPESYSSYGPSRLFVDQRRGSVLRIDGMSYQSDKMTVVSNLDMRSWFKEELAQAENTIILSQYDPANDEFVVSLTGVAKPVAEEVGVCGGTEIISINGSGESFSKKYTIEKGYGSVELYIRVSTNEIGMVSLTATGLAEPILFGDDTDATVILPITNAVAGEIQVLLNATDPDTVAEVMLEVGCLEPRQIKVVQYVLTSNSDAGKAIEVGYKYKKGSVQSPYNKNAVSIGSYNSVYPLSFSKTTIGSEGDAMTPMLESLLTVRVSGLDTPGGIQFDASNRVLLKESSTELDIPTILETSDASLTITKQADGSYEGSALMSNMSTTIIYILYDFRKIRLVDLKQDISGSLACCGDSIPVPSRMNDMSLRYATCLFDLSDDIGISPYTSGFYSDGATSVKIENSVIASRDICPMCSAITCGDALLFDSDGYDTGVYSVPIYTEGEVGLARVRILFDESTDWSIGARVVDADGNVYSKVYGIVYPSGVVYPDDLNKPTFFGKNHDDCAIPGTFSLPEYLVVGGDVIATGATNSINITVDQIDLHSGVETFGFTFLVPVTKPSSDIITLELFILCAGVKFTIQTVCPELLQAVAVRRIPTLSCDVVALNETIYMINRGATPAVKDNLFLDVFGSVPAPTGYYRSLDKVYTVGDSGVITAITSCAAIPGTAVGFLSTSSPGSKISICDSSFDITYYNTGGDGIVSVGDTIYTDTMLSTTIIASGRPAGTYKLNSGYMVVNSSGVVTDISTSCVTPLNSITATNVFDTRFKALLSTANNTFYYHSSVGDFGIGSIIYLDSARTAPIAVSQGAGYMVVVTLYDASMVEIDSNSTVINIEPAIL